jgi:protein gp37
MSEQTGIEWCDSTFNPWIGCTKVGAGCDHCYAEQRMDTRLNVVHWGAGQPRKRTSAANWRDPIKWNAAPFFECPDCGMRGDAKAMGHDPKDCKHLNAYPARRRVFCASLADVFDNEVDPAWRIDLFELIAATPNLDWLILTKRIGNVMPMCSGDGLMFDMICQRVWLGATIVNQEEADRDIPKLLDTPAAVRFLSMEPLLGPVLLSAYDHDFLEGWTVEPVCCGRPGSECCGCPDPSQVQTPRIDWVIVGGESGQGARPMHPDWVRSLRDQCAAAGVPYLFKQWGEWVGDDQEGARTVADKLVTSLLYNDNSLMLRVGKKLAGRTLDGRTHTEYPKVTA